jgi:murein DD-endopeptidase MepM/ murein hydrolase activator NlpD
MIELRLPLKCIAINQPFGVNYADFYEKLGMIGHNGIDFKAYRGCPCYASHDGVAETVRDSDGGLGVKVFDYKNKFRTLQYHLLDFAIKDKQPVASGDLIGHCDNTGSMTTGDHDHFDLKLTDDLGNTLDNNNGFKGAINPAQYFKFFYDGTPLNNKDWNKSRAYHRYGRPRTWLAEYWFRFAPAGINNQWANSGRWVQKRLKYLGYEVPALNGEQVNAIIYGGWDFEAVLNPAMFENWSQLTKDEYNKGERPFQ